MNESRTPREEFEHPESGRPVFESGRPVFIEIAESELIKRAVQVGKAAGATVALLRDARRRLREHGSTQDDRISELATATKSRVWELRREAAEHAEDWRQAAMEKTAEFRRKTKASYEQARNRANRAGREHPLQVILVAGIIGFLIGAGLRIRRAHHGT